MSTPPDELARLLLSDEDEHLEFKEAKNSFDQEKLANDCAALANERGGTLVLGVTDKHPLLEDAGRTRGARWYPGPEPEDP